MQILDSIIEGALMIPDRAEADAYIAAVVRFLAADGDGGDPEGLPPYCAALFASVRPVLDKSRKRARAGAKGGSSQGAANKADGAEEGADGEAGREAEREAEPKANGEANREAKRQANGEAKTGFAPLSYSYSNSHSKTQEGDGLVVVGGRRTNAERIAEQERRAREQIDRFRRMEAEGRAVSGFARSGAAHG